MSLVKVSPTVSDLFFMVDNRAYWNALENCPPKDAEDILLQSASDFCDLIENLGEQYTPEEIVEDFLDRV